MTATIVMVVSGKKASMFDKTSGQNYDGNWVLHKLQVSLHKILNNDKVEKSSFTVMGKCDLKLTH